MNGSPVLLDVHGLMKLRRIMGAMPMGLNVPIGVSAHRPRANVPVMAHMRIIWVS